MKNILQRAFFLFFCISLNKHEGKNKEQQQQHCESSSYAKTMKQFKYNYFVKLFVAVWCAMRFMM